MITTFGEIMLRLTPKNIGERIIQALDFSIEPGGSESNVAIALSNLGIKSTFVTALPSNPLSIKILLYLKQFGINTEFIKEKGQKIGIYWTETGVGPRNSYVIYDREQSAFSNSIYEDFEWREILKKTRWFHFSGITPAVSESVTNMLFNVVKECECPVSVDLNFREKLWNWVNKDTIKINQIMSALCSNATLLLGNETDFQNILGMTFEKINDKEDFIYIAKKCFEKLEKVQYIAISNRISTSATLNEWTGYLFVRNNTNFIFEGLNYKLDNIQDRLGTGDSFVAGIIYGLYKTKSSNFQEIINFAVSLSALNHTTKGDASRFSESDVLLMMNSKGSGRIIR